VRPQIGLNQDPANSATLNIRRSNKMNMMRGLVTAVIGLAAAMQGCTLTPQKLHLDPQIEVTGAPVTSDTLVALTVLDSRPSKKLGEVGDPKKEMFDVTLDEDFVPLLTERLTQALEQRGFSVVPESGGMTRTLVVEISSLQLNSVKTPVTFETELRAEVSASADNSNERYQRVYYVRTYQETAGPPFEKHSNQLVNQAVSQALSDMLNDDNLFELIAR
jgi:uncharacterized lipoprotein